MNKSTPLLLGSLALAVAALAHYSRGTSDSDSWTGLASRKPAASLPQQPQTKSPQHFFLPGSSSPAPAPMTDTTRVGTKESRAVALDVVPTPVVLAVTGDASPAGLSATGNAASRSPRSTAAPTSPQAASSSGTSTLPLPAETQPDEHVQVFELPLGLKVPASLVESDPTPDIFPLHEDLKKEITEHFLQAIDSNVASSSAGTVADGDAWVAAQTSSDARFRKLFGDAVYQRQNLKGARIALGLAE